MYMRFGLCGEDPLTQKEVAQKLDISQSYISRLEKKIIDKIRKEVLKTIIVCRKIENDKLTNHEMI